MGTSRTDFLWLTMVVIVAPHIEREDVPTVLGFVLLVWAVYGAASLVATCLRDRKG